MDVLFGVASPRICFFVNDLLVQATRLPHGLDSQLLRKNALALVELSYCPRGATQTDQVLHKRIVEAFPARVANEGRTANLRRFGVVAAFSMAIRRPGQHFQI
jgi:hypothetical protein